MFSAGCNNEKLKTNLRLCIQRLKMLEKKKTELALKARKEIAEYIKAGKPDRARIKVELIIREDYLVEAMEIIEMFCDLLLARYGLIKSQSQLDPGLEESVATLIWVTPRLQAETQEFKVIAEQLTAKYGKEFSKACLANSLQNVNTKVMQKLNVSAPPCNLVELYMIEIAKSFNVQFEPDENLLNGGLDNSGNPNATGGAGSSGGGGMGGLTALIDLEQPPDHHSGRGFFGVDVEKQAYSEKRDLPPLPQGFGEAQPHVKPEITSIPPEHPMGGMPAMPPQDHLSSSCMPPYNKEKDVSTLPPAYEPHPSPGYPMGPDATAGLPPLQPQPPCLPPSLPGACAKGQQPGSSAPAPPELPSDGPVGNLYMLLPDVPSDGADSKGGGGQNDGAEEDDFRLDDLSARFNQLKKKK